MVDKVKEVFDKLKIKEKLIDDAYFLVTKTRLPNGKSLKQEIEENFQVVVSDILIQVMDGNSSNG